MTTGSQKRQLFSIGPSTNSILGVRGSGRVKLATPRSVVSTALGTPAVVTEICFSGTKSDCVQIHLDCLSSRSRGMLATFSHNTQVLVRKLVSLNWLFSSHAELGNIVLSADTEARFKERPINLNHDTVLTAPHWIAADTVDDSCYLLAPWRSQELLHTVGSASLTKLVPVDAGLDESFKSYRRSLECSCNSLRFSPELRPCVPEQTDLEGICYDSMGAWVPVYEVNAVTVMERPAYLSIDRVGSVIVEGYAVKAGVVPGSGKRLS